MMVLGVIVSRIRRAYESSKRTRLHNTTIDEIRIDSALADKNRDTNNEMNASDRNTLLVTYDYAVMFSTVFIQ
jgi:hypothetical protein